MTGRAIEARFIEFMEDEWTQHDAGGFLRIERMARRCGVTLAEASALVAGFLASGERDLTKARDVE